MLKAFGLSTLSIADVRSAEQFKLSHELLAMNVPAQTFKSHRHSPAKLAALLREAGVNCAVSLPQ